VHDEVIRGCHSTHFVVVEVKDPGEVGSIHDHEVVPVDWCPNSRGSSRWRLLVLTLFQGDGWLWCFLDWVVTSYLHGGGLQGLQVFPIIAPGSTDSPVPGVEREPSDSPY
jgi:hypothetical protein